MQHTCGARQAGTSDAREGEGERPDPARLVEPVEIRIRHPGLAVACRRSRSWFWRLGELADVLASRELSPSISSSWSTAVLVVRARWIFIDDLISCPRAQQAILGSSRSFALGILVLVGTSLARRRSFCPASSTRAQSRAALAGSRIAAAIARAAAPQQCSPIGRPTLSQK